MSLPSKKNIITKALQSNKVPISVLVLSSLLSIPTYAQNQVGDAEEGKKSNVNSMMESIVVTARKTEENIQDAPLSVTAFSGDGLEARGIESIVEVGSVTPNLTYQSSPGAGGSSSVASVYIRGVGQRDFIGTIDNGVGFYIDGVYIARTVGATVDLLDVDRVEVLRGPQGTLFGRNNIGGAIALYSKKPTDTFEGYIDATVGTDALAKLKFSVNGALTEDLFGNFSVLSASQKGYVDRPAGGDLGDDDNTSYRGALLFNASDSLEISLTGDYSTEKENGPAFTLSDAGALVDGGFPGFYNNVTHADDCAYPAGLTESNGLCYNSQWESEDSNLGTSPTYSNTDTWGLNLQVAWDISDDLKFKSITAYRDLDAEFAKDSDGSPLTVVQFYDLFSSKQFSQELQLSGSSFEGNFDWITGLYYFNEEGNNINVLEFAIAEFASDNDFTTESMAAFAQGTYHITEKLDLTLGLRYTDEEKTFDPIQTVISSNIGYAPGTPILPLGLNTRDTQETSPLVNLAYNFDEGLMVYANYSEGFRSGGYVQRIFPPLETVPEFDPEYVEAYEVGFKYDHSDLPLVVNGAAFFMDYTDIQVRTQNPGFVGFFEANVGNAEISGFELEVKWSPADMWFVEANVGYTKAEYTSIDVEAPLVAVITTDSEFDHVPEWSTSLSVSRDFELDNGSYLTARISGNYHTSYFNNPENTPGVKTPELSLWDATFIWRSPDEVYGFDFGIKNLTDEKYITAGYNNPSIGTTEVIKDRGLNWYASFRYNFD
jgi:iron complex outermembrane receptor protein